MRGKFGLQQLAKLIASENQSAPALNTVGFDLADNRKIEPPRNTTELISGTRHIRAEYSLFGGFRGRRLLLQRLGQVIGALFTLHPL
jgi:hypothetical protein